MKLAILIYCQEPGGRDALTEEKYKDLAFAFMSSGAEVESVCYNDRLAKQLAVDLLKFDAILVWVNPIEQGNDRTILDSLLIEVASKGCFVSTHPEIILKLGTKEILYTTREMSWSGDIKLYRNPADFANYFQSSLNTGTRVLKQYRGNGGNGVFKIEKLGKGEVSIVHASGNIEKIISEKQLVDEFHPFFSNNGMLIDQKWNDNHSNGMVRCYLSGSKIAGFGYQEINALAGKPVSKRYYYSESCGLFQDLKGTMENDWVPQLKNLLDIPDHLMPVIWDADFFINSIEPSENKYELCEINVSCVSPFPPSAIPFIVDSVSNLSV